MAEDNKSSRNLEVVTDKEGRNYRRTVAHLPAYYRTDANQRFLSSTLDPLVQKGNLQRLDGYIGRPYAYTRQSADKYVSATSELRKNYQLEPTVTYIDKDTSSVNPEDRVKFTATYDDFINQIEYLGGIVDNHDRLTKEDVYSWNSAVDLDKLINYREYYWLPEGPNPILVSTIGPGISYEIDVTANGSTSYRFGTHGNTDNPQITLYRGNTYKFVKDTTSHPFYIMTEPFKTGIAVDGSTSVLYDNGVTNNGVKKGTLTFVVPENAPDTLHYQCGSHSAMNGIIKIKDINDATKIDVAEQIVNLKNYTFSGGTALSNGMKIKFGNNVLDTETYANKEFYVEGVGEKITLTDTTKLITPESYAEETTTLYDESAYDSRPYSIAFYRPTDPDYITIKRDSIDGNAWSRYNRWFHRAMIEDTATINGLELDLLEQNRAKRPIIEFDSGLSLYDHGVVAKNSVTVIDSVTTDVGSTIVNNTGYIVDGITLTDGMRVLFTADPDSQYKNKIYKVNFVTFNSTSVINLTLESDGTPTNGDNVFVEFGTVNQGKTFYYKSATTEWATGQEKTKLNQQPLFGMFDNSHISFDNSTTYPNSDFIGAKVFEYKISDSAPLDTVLGLRVKYNTVQNVGDIVFTSDLLSGTFKYKSGDQFVSKFLGSGHLHYTTGLTTHNSKNGWIKRSEQSKQRVIRTYDVTEDEKQLFAIDVYKDSKTLTDLEVSVDVDHQRKDLNTDYTLVDGTVNKYVKFTKALAVGNLVKITTHSNSKKLSGKGVYEVPENLSTNPLNASLDELTYGQILNHLHDIHEKNIDIVGAEFPGNTNLRDLPDVKLKGGTIIQHSSPLTNALFSLIDTPSNFISALDYCSSSYQKFKESILNYQVGTDYDGTISQRLDEIIEKLKENKNNTFPFFYEDMMGYGENVSVRTYTVQDSSEVDYAIDSQFDVTSLSNRAVYVYLNDTQLVRDHDFTFDTTDDSINITTTLAVGDKIVIKDYADTTASFVPPTPTKMGMYPKYKPELVSDNTYTTTKNVIIGHDGSRTIAYGDYRDDLLLEFEKRIYNNIKVEHDPTLLDESDVKPSAFTETEYSNNEVDSILALDFYNWAGINAVQYQKQNFVDGDPFTYNYSTAKSSLANEFLPGHWRGIFKYFYDTDRPHTHPWEMLGYSEKPSSWETNYGPAPYSAGNTVMWQDLEAGFDKHTQTTKERYIREGLTNYIPVDENGNLLNPIKAKLLQSYDATGIRKSWVFGDQGPGETAWRRSAQYPFAVMRMLALTKPAQFFGQYLDNSALSTNTAGNLIDSRTGIRQRLSTSRYHLETVTNTVTGITTRYQTAGYQPFVVNYLIKNNLDPAVFFYDKMKNLNVQLSYKLGGFTDKENIKILTDSVSPASTSGSQFVPDENYKIIFRTSNPVDRFDYSGVLIEANTDIADDGSTLVGGYKVIGYNKLRPYFQYFSPIKNSNSTKFVIGSTEAIFYNTFDTTAKQLTYGSVLKTKQDVVDFLLGYEAYLKSRGFAFESYSRELKEVNEWKTSAREFLYWTTQGWAAGSAITMSAGADGFSVTTKNSVVNKLNNLVGEYTVLDSQGRNLSTKDISTKRVGTNFEIKSTNVEQGIFNIVMNAVQKEHLILFDNKTVFSDIIYDPATGFRQQRLKLVGWKTGDWNGDYYSPGFVFDEAKVNLWTNNKDYNIGDTVEYQNNFYVAKVNHNSRDSFENENWQIKKEKPNAQLIPNFDYKISQFNDFYNLETNNFDESQQTLAQHLIGYQSRDYLENLFVNDVTQYKFYQGFIREKGTLNAIDKLVKAQFNGENISLDIYPEWMIKTGEIGNVDNKKSIQFEMDDDKFLYNTQSIELLDSDTTSKNFARSAVVLKENFYQKPIDYTAQTTFAQYDYTKEGFDSDVVQKYKTAGYARQEDVQHTAFNINDLLNLDVNRISNNDLIWIAKKENTDWDVQRITNTGVNIISIQPLNNQTELRLTFSDSHGFSKNDFVLISNSQFTELNGVYKITSVPDHKNIVFDFEETGIQTFGTLADGSTLDSYGNVYKFVSVRLSSMNNVNSLLSYSEYQDKDDLNSVNGDRVFVDNNGNSKWSIYEKCDPYTLKLIESPSTTNDQEFGYKVVARNDGRFLAISAPNTGQGTIHFFFRRDNVPGDAFQIQSSLTMTDNDDNTSRLGESLRISTDENFIMAGAPYTNTIGLDGSTRFSDSGLVKTYLWNNTAKNYAQLNTITPPSDEAGQNFGWDIAMAEPGANSIRSTQQKYLFVSAPGKTSDSGAVYMYTWGTGNDGSTYDTWTQDVTITSNDPGSGKRFGNKIAVNDNGDILAVASVSSGTAGKVEIFTRGGTSNDGSTQNTWTHRQTLTAVSSDGSSQNNQFGFDLAMSRDGTKLLITAPGFDNDLQDDAGVVYYYKWNADGSTNTYTLQQTLNAPETQTNMKFGTSIDITPDSSRIIIGASKFNTKRKMKFDNGATTFDLQDTHIVDINKESGGVFTATMYDTDYVIDDKLVTAKVTANDEFGKSVFAIDGCVFSGSPSDDSDSGVSNDGTVSSFDLNELGVYAWKPIVTEQNLIDDRKITSAFVFDKAKSQIIDYLDLYDPVKGNILGIADREINVKSEWDPAVYNVGGETNNVNDSISWTDDHLGEVWWDLSTVKWLWYEQGTQEYRTKNWGKIFPGSQIDVYEWTESTILPSQWATLADTPQGLAQNISGQPLNSDDTVYSIKQKYDSKIDTLVNYYYFWVKNSVNLPDPNKSSVVRKNTTSFVSNIIRDPLTSGKKFYAITDTNKLLTFNVKNILFNNNIILNIDYKENLSEAESNAVWKIVQEGNKDDRPNLEIETRWWNSLVGRNEAGDSVPDIDLPVNQRYGNNLRPRQSWYVDRFRTLKEIITYTNSVLKKNQIANSISYSNLDSKEPEPTAQSGLWDEKVDTYADLTYKDTRDISGTVDFLVSADENSNGYWAIYRWDGTTFSRTRVQTYKTDTYYKLVDWYKVDGSMTHDENTFIDKQVKYEYELDELDLEVGKHAKVTNADTGGWKLYMKTNQGWENVGTENGTIQLEPSLYDYSVLNTGYAGDDTFDENFFDAEPSIETRNVLKALRDDIFVGDLKIEYNNIFFISLREVLEQSNYVDWLFKSSFINVRNSFRSLDQRKTYTVGTDSYVESYINEVKPFHTKVREYNLGYTSLDTQDSINTDFDNPAFYDTNEGKIRSIDPDGPADATRITQYPWKFWNDNYKRFVQSVVITNAGSGYTQTPTVTITGGGGSGATATAVVSDGSVKSISVTNAGSGYTSTPTVLITGGESGGSTPTNQAKASVRLGNAKVRDIQTTIKFDRISKTATVLDWTSNTVYEYGTLIRFNNELYRATNRFTSTTDFDDNEGSVQKLRGDESYITATERTLGLYTPTTEMPGNELSQLMKGIDYGGVMVTGLDFTNDQGWDKSNWYLNPWDNYGTSRSKTFYGDGSTVTFSFDTAPATTEVYTVYFDGTRQTSEVFRGDGTTTSFTLSSAPGNGVKVEFIPFDDDKVLTPTDDRTLDTQLSGGLFSSVLGQSPSDIIVEGDAFVTPETSFAPEENVPGSIFDTLDIKVYTTPLSGVPFIVNKTYFGDDSTVTFSIGQKPGTSAGVFVTVNNTIQTLNTDFTVDVENETITLTTTPVTGAVINVRSFAVSGSNYVVLNEFTGDGSTTDFETASRDTYQLDSALPTLYVTKNGVPQTVSTDYTTSESNKKITVSFTSAPASGDSIQVAGFNQDSTSRAYAEVRTQEIEYDGSTLTYPLTYPAGAIGPYAGLTLVELNGSLLRGPDNTYYSGDDSTATFTYAVSTMLSDGSTVDPAKTITSNSQIEVYKNGSKQLLNTDYTVDIAQQNVNFVLAPASGDIIVIATKVDKHYTVTGSDLVIDTSQISSDSISLSQGDKFVVTTFNNAFGMKQRREVLEGRTNGEFYLSADPFNSDYTYVALNQELLVANNDYTIENNKITIFGKTITTSDRLDVMYFAIESNTGATGFRIFKDMLNRTFYKRISKTHTTKLTQDLLVDSTTITVEDGTILGQPNVSANMPGVIFVDKERIEYFSKTGNTLGQLRRGTLGTGIKVHASGADVVDASGQQTVPYADTISSKTYTGDGSTVSFATTTAPSSASELDIFIGGQRVLLTSEDGSTVNYIVDGSTANVTLTTPPASGVQIKIIQKTGSVWYDAGVSTAANGKGLQKANTYQARFIAGEPTNAPE